MSYKLTCALLAAIFLLMAGACNLAIKQSYYAPGNNNPTGTGTLVGVGFSPKSSQPFDIIAYFAKAKEVGKVICWAGDWKELEYARGFPTLLSEQAYSNGLKYIIELRVSGQFDGKLFRSLDDKTLQKYQDSAVDFAGRYRPAYLTLGDEVNTLYQKSPGDFTKLVKLFDATYDAVKKASPNTKVFTTFQLEEMKGLNGGQYGGSNDTTKAQWALLDKFPKSDLVAFDTYPDMIYKAPADIPADYFSDIALHTKKPVAIVGTGWHSSAGPAGWESSEAQQAEYAKEFLVKAGDMHAEFAVWSYLYDQNLPEPFKSMGLLQLDDSPRQAWYAWTVGK